MGLLSGITSNVAIVMKADTSQAKRATRELAGEQKKLAKATVEGLEKQNEALDRSLKKWGKIAAGVGSAVLAFKGAQAAFAEYAKDAQLKGATAGISIDKLRKASQGLVSDLDLMTQAAALNNTQFKLNTEEMAEVQRFMLILRKQGNDYADVQKNVTKALVENTTEGLKPFGIAMKEISDKGEAHRAIMQRIREENQKFTGSLSISGDEAKKSGKSVSNSFREIKVAVGELVKSLGPLIAALAKAVSIAAKAVTMITSELDMRQIAEDKGQSSLSNSQIALNTFHKMQRDAAAKRLKANKAQADAFAAALLTPGAPGVVRTGGGSFDGGPGAAIGSVTRLGGNFGVGGWRAQIGDSGIDSTLNGLNSADSQLDVTRAGIDAQNQQMAQKARRLQEVKNRNAFFGAKEQTFLESTFGPVGQFDAYAGAFQGLTSAVGASMQAWISGSKSMAAAFKEAIASSLGGLAVQMQVEALKETAYGFSRLAWSDLPGAAGHFKSAAGFQAGAIAAAVGAKALGGGAPSSSPVGGSAPNVIGSGGGSGGGNNVTVIMGDDFSQTDGRKRAARLRRTIRDARSYAGESEVTFG